MGEIRNAYRIVVEKHEGKASLGRTRRRCQDILEETLGTYDGHVDWIHLAQDREQWWALVNIVMNVRVP